MIKFQRIEYSEDDVVVFSFGDAEVHLFKENNEVSFHGWHMLNNAETFSKADMNELGRMLKSIAEELPDDNQG